MYKMPVYLLIFMLIINFLFAGCALKPVEFIKNADYMKYKFVYVSPSNTVTSTSGYINASYSGYTYSSSYTQQTNPSDIITGFFMKKNFIIVNEIRSPENTIIINYGQSGKRDIAGGIAYTLEVTIQLLDAKTHKLIFQCSAEGMGSTEADDIRTAINRCLESLQ